MSFLVLSHGCIYKIKFFHDLLNLPFEMGLLLEMNSCKWPDDKHNAA